MKKTITGIIIVLAVLALAWVAVGRLGNPLPAPVISPEEASTKLNELFREPDETEITAVKEEWQKRNTKAADWKVEKIGTIDGRPLWVVSHRVDGNRHYGLIRFPETPQSGKKYPVLLYNHAGNDGVTLKTLALLDNQFFTDGCIKNNFIYVIPTFRGERLDAENLGTFQSDGKVDVLDRDVDDALTLLSGVLENVPEANADEIVSLGISRGGGVSLLAGARDERIKAVAELSGMTDFFMPSIEKESIDLYVSRRISANPVMEVAMNVVNDFMKGKKSLGEARLALLHSSAAYFARHMPVLQIHHGSLDPLIPIEHSESLDQALQAAGRGTTADQYFRYYEGEHDILSMKDSGLRIEKFLCPIVEGGMP